ncbi:hypothetical protein CRV24_000544 [Beauveria bassiana]|nr:hypothetical protein CRV24_000544 [Beauveria bassiana]
MMRAGQLIKNSAVPKSSSRDAPQSPPSRQTVAALPSVLGQRNARSESRSQISNIPYYQNRPSHKAENINRKACVLTPQDQCIIICRLTLLLEGSNCCGVTFLGAFQALTQNPGLHVLFWSSRPRHAQTDLFRLCPRRSTDGRYAT